MVLEKNGKIKWTEEVSNKVVLRRVDEERSILTTVLLKEANYIEQTLIINC